jgi:hypothetical protein
MLTFIIKHSFLISFIMLLTLFGAGLFLPAILLPLGILLVLLVFGISIALMRQTYQAQYQSRAITEATMHNKMSRGLVMLSIILLLTILLGIWVSGQVSGLVGNLVEVRWKGQGNVAALVSAILASFAVGYLVRWGVGRWDRK